MTFTASLSALCFTEAFSSGEAVNCSTRRSISFLSGAIPSSCCIERTRDP
jgi:hypothetical protein